MTFDDFKNDLAAWFDSQYTSAEAEMNVTLNRVDLACVTLTCKKPNTPEHPSFLISWEDAEALNWARSIIERRTKTKAERRQQLMEVDIDEEMGGWIDDFYTDFYVTEEDRQCIERFLRSSNVDNRSEALLALVLATGPSGPKYAAYALDALIVHLLGIVEDEDAQFTGVSMLAELKNRGDKEAQSMLESLGRTRNGADRFGISGCPKECNSSAAAPASE